jgi:hypothetical protein
MAITKKPWQEPQVKSIDDLSLAYGAACTPTGSAPTGQGGKCQGGNSATGNCQSGNSPNKKCLNGARP